MKQSLRFVIILLGLLTGSSLRAQQQTVTADMIGRNYYFITSVPESVSKQNAFAEDAPVLIKKDRIINVLDIQEDSVLFKYWPFTSGAVPKDFAEKVYVMPLAEFERVAAPLYQKSKGFSVGAYTVPFRLRGAFTDNFDFESSLSLQMNMIWGYGNKYKPESWLDLSIGIGLTGIALSPENSTVTEERTASAFTCSFGAVLKPKPYINAGIFVGWDWLGAKDRPVAWTYNGDTWIGVGINVSFNEVKGTESMGIGKKSKNNE